MLKSPHCWTFVRAVLGARGGTVGRTGPSFPSRAERPVGSSLSRLAANLAAGKLPAVSFTTPNVIDDMHDGTVAGGDKWLSANLPTILSSPEYTSGSTAVFITWDEGEGGTSNRCATNTTDVGCHVATLVISPSTKPGTKSATLFNHYSLLGTAEQLLGLPKLGKASSATTMTAAVNL